ncbi:hypothetical protein QFC20_006324 [Naganishia adeliensis]|uniref:Uncharacterized protein n=1 Tax=Naganishia adeliensis TaxID=92952 RepID=A0ACC2VD08_9TREE|nr:hypothetical protein QFC20_006324 [Naganishia adeliensis]
MSDVKAQLAALAARQSGGKTTDPAALQTPSAINARVPTVPGQEEKAKADAKKGKGKGKMSSRQKQRAEKMRQVAVDLGAKIEKKVAAKEGRKDVRERSLDRSEMPMTGIATTSSSRADVLANPSPPDQREGFQHLFHPRTRGNRRCLVDDDDEQGGRKSESEGG